MHQMRCPKCGKRLMDISKLLNEDIAASLKCLNCKNIVRINLEKKNVKKTYRAEK